MTASIDRIHFNDLAACDPQDVCRRSGAQYDDQNGCYRLVVWGQAYAIDANRCRIDCLSDSARPCHDYLYLFMVHYLLSVQEIDVAGQWISEKDLPGGAAFFRGPHEIPTRLVASRFEEDPHRYTKRCRDLHGAALDMADAAHGFGIAPRIPVAVLCWAGDEDFPAETRILYDRSIIHHLALDVVFALAVGICQTLGQPF